TATGATVNDTLPAILLSPSWSCTHTAGASCTAGPVNSGTISDTVTIPASGSVTYTVTGTIDPAATGTLSNTASVTAPSGTLDCNTGNNSATDNDTLVPTVDLQMAKTDGVTTVTAGGTTTYTVTVTNAGPSE